MKKNIPAPAIFSKLLMSGFSDTVNNKEYKNKFALPVKVDIDFISTANRNEKEDEVIYSLTLNAENALNITCQFSKFQLSKNAVLGIFTSYEITDSITAKENNPNNIWATRVYQDNRMNIVLKIPKSEVGQTMLQINQVGFGFMKIGGFFFGNPGESATCNINVLCPQGNGWQNERNSVALIVSNGIENCTGSLIMNTCGTNRPYLLTANHCLNGNVQNWVFQFQTWSNTCIPNGTFREDVQFNGCQLRANNAATDFALVELNQTPATNSGITYSGWNRNANAATRTTSIHHPMGDVMKVSNDFAPPVPVSWITGPANYWRAIFDEGIVQFGSSGAALFDQNNRIVGQLFGNQNNVCAFPGTNQCWCTTQIPSVGEYGRFDVSWTGGGTNATRLSNWLDPSGSNAFTTNTTNISNLFGSLTINGNDNLCAVPNTYTIPNLPAGATVAWSTTPSNLTTPSTGTGTTFTTNRVGTLNGNVTLTANVSTPACGLVQSINKTIKVGLALSDLNVNYSRNAGSFQVIDFGGLNNKAIYTQAGNFAVTAFTALPGSNTFNWVVSGPPPGGGYGWSNFTKSGPNCSFTLTGTNAPTIPLQVTLTNTQNGCTASIDKIVVFVASIPGGTSSNIVISPNPAADAIKIEEMDASTGLQKTTNSTITAIELTDKMGNTVYSKTFNTKMAPSPISIPVSQFKNDVYTLRIFNGIEWEVQQIIIQH